MYKKISLLFVIGWVCIGQALTIIHTPIKQINENRPINFSVELQDVPADAKVTLLYKTGKDIRFSEVDMMAERPGFYSTVIAPITSAGDKIVYYVAVIAGNLTIKTLPESNPEEFPFKVLVQGDEFAPVIKMLMPEDGEVVRDGSPVMLFSLQDDLRQLDLETLTIKINGMDVTKLANISKTMVSYTPERELNEGEYRVLVEVSDVKGAKIRKESIFTFRAKDPEFLTYKGKAGAETVLYSTDKPASSQTQEAMSYKSFVDVDLKAAMINAKVNVIQDSKESNLRQPLNRLKINLYDDKRFFDWKLMDSNPVLSNMTLSGILVQGNDLTLGFPRLLQVRGIAGQTKRAISISSPDVMAGTFKQSVEGVQLYSNLFGFENSLSYVHIADDVKSIVSPNQGATLPQEGHVLGLENHLNLFDIDLRLESALSIYYSDTTSPILSTINAGGKVITISATDLAKESGLDKALIESILNRFPIRQCLVDRPLGFATQFDVQMPLLFREYYFKGNMKYTDPWFYSLGNSGMKSDNFEYSGDFSFRFFRNLLSLGIGYGRQQDNAREVFSKLFPGLAITGNVSTFTDTYRVNTVVAVPNIAAINVGYNKSLKNKDVTDNTRVKNVLDSLQVGVNGIEMVVDKFVGKINLSYGVGQYVDTVVTGNVNDYTMNAYGANVQTEWLPFKLKFDLNLSNKISQGVSANTQTYTTFGSMLYYDVIAKVFATYVGAKITLGADTTNTMNNSRSTLSCGGTYRLGEIVGFFSNTTAMLSADLLLASDSLDTSNKSKNYGELLTQFKISADF